MFCAELYCTVLHRTLHCLSHRCLCPLIPLLPLLFLRLCYSPYTHVLSPPRKHTCTLSHTQTLTHTYTAELGRVASRDCGIWVSIPERRVQGVYIHEQHTLNDVEHLQVSTDFASFIYLFIYFCFLASAFLQKKFFSFLQFCLHFCMIYFFSSISGLFSFLRLSPCKG
jgi:hypothetical protein